MSTETLPSVLPPLIPLDAPSAQTDNKQANKELRALSDAQTATESALLAESVAVTDFEKADEEVRKSKYLGQLALGLVPNSRAKKYEDNPSDFDKDMSKFLKKSTVVERDGSLPIVGTEDEVEDKVEKIRGKAVHKNRRLAQAMTKDATNPTKNIGKKRRIANPVAQVVNAVNISKSRNQRRIAREDLSASPLRKRTKHQKRADRGLPRAVKAHESTGVNSSTERSRKKEISKISSNHNNAEKSQKMAELLEIRRTITSAEHDSNSKTRHYNELVERVNADREEYLRLVNQAANLNEAINQIEGSTVPEDVTKLGEMQSKRDEIERAIRANELRGAESRQLAKAAKEEQANSKKTSVETKQFFEDLGNNNVLSFDKAIEAISYADIAGSPEEKAAFEVYTRNRTPHGRDYAKALTEVVAAHGLPKLEAMAAEALEQSRQRLESHGITSSRFGESVSWFLWDVAKQSYFVKNPTEADPGYTISDPMLDFDKQEEILDRHIGWELYQKYQSIPVDDRPTFIYSHGIPASAVTLLNKEPKENRTLSSSDLAKLGEQIF